MSEARNRATIEALVAAINARDLKALDKVFTEDVIIEWPQSGDRVLIQAFPGPRVAGAVDRVLRG